MSRAGEDLTRTWRGGRIGVFAAGVEYVVADYLSLFVEYVADLRGPRLVRRWKPDRRSFLGHGLGQPAGAGQRAPKPGGPPRGQAR